jgi:hypothetical protein
MMLSKFERFALFVLCSFGIFSTAWAGEVGERCKLVQRSILEEGLKFKIKLEFTNVLDARDSMTYATTFGLRPNDVDPGRYCREVATSSGTYASFSMSPNIAIDNYPGVISGSRSVTIKGWPNESISLGGLGGSQIEIQMLNSTFSAFLERFGFDEFSPSNTDSKVTIASYFGGISLPARDNAWTDLGTAKVDELTYRVAKVSAEVSLSEIN